MMRHTLARAVRGLWKIGGRAASRLRKIALVAQYPDLRFEGNVFIGPGCVIQVGRSAHLTIRACHISRNSTIVAGAGSRMIIDADYIGPNCTVVSRELVEIGAGSKLAENVVIRDANHDHAFPLSAKQFVHKPIRIGDDTWLGASSMVLAGVQILQGATVAAGAVVTRDVPAGATVAGVPARILQPRGRTK